MDQIVAAVMPLLGAVLAVVLAAEGFCYMLSLPYHPLRATIQWIFRSAMRLVTGAIRTVIDLFVQIIRAIAVGIVEGVRGGWARVRARP